MQYREVRCFPPAANATAVPDSYCTADAAAGARPASSRSCVNTDNCSFSWQCRKPGATEWAACSSGDAQFSACPAGCGETAATREVRCVNPSNVEVDESACVTSKPLTTRACSATSTCTYGWRCLTSAATALEAPAVCSTGSSTVGWSACDTSCGPGASTRNVVCLNLNLGVPVDSSLCVTATGAAPESSRACTGTGSCLWRAGTWSTCSPQCRALSTSPNGARARVVSCTGVLSNGTAVAVASSLCSSSSAPVSSETCADTPLCSAANKPFWVTGAAATACVAECGTGYQTRSVACQLDGAIVSDGLCIASTRPAAIVACNATTAACPQASTSVESSQCVDREVTVTLPIPTTNGSASTASETKTITTGVCVCANGFTGATCTAPPSTVSAVSYSPSGAVYRGTTLFISWTYTPSAAALAADETEYVTIMYERSGMGEKFPVPIATVAAADGTYSWLTPLDLPTATAAQISVHVATGIRARSLAFAVPSVCSVGAYCNGNGQCKEDLDSGTATCACESGFTGTRCDVGACDDAKCYQPGTASVTADTCACNCNSAYTGATCLTPLNCTNAASFDRVVCANGGVNQPPASGSNAVCGPCACTNAWEDDTDVVARSNRGCTRCGLSCGAHGSGNTDCTACTCAAGYAGARCQCRAVTLALSFKYTVLPWTDKIGRAHV